MNSEDNLNKLPCDSATFVKLLLIATIGIFLCKNKLFQQIDGVAMGSLMGPTLGNFFLAKMEENIMSIASTNHSLLYLHYVKDIFAVFETNKSRLKVLGILNSQHENIKFTVEYGSELMCFLDVQIEVEENGCDTWTWRKTTHTGILLIFDALYLLKWKSGLVLCLLNRAKAICSSKLLFKNDVIKLRQIFLSNGYPDLDF